MTAGPDRGDARREPAAEPDEPLYDLPADYRSPGPDGSADSEQATSRDQPASRERQADREQPASREQPPDRDAGPVGDPAPWDDSRAATDPGRADPPVRRRPARVRPVPDSLTDRLGGVADPPGSASVPEATESQVQRRSHRADPSLRSAPPPVTGSRVEPAPARGIEGGPRPDALASDALVRTRRHAAPLTGWRRVLRTLTLGTVKPGPSPAQVRHAEQVSGVRTPITGTHRVAVISLKGGVGKTTTTMMLGSTLASLRGDRVIAVDANPDAGTLGDRLPRQTTATIRDLLTHYSEVRTWADLAAYTSQAASRLEVIANDVDPSVSTAITAADYLRVVEMLGRYYSVVLTDSGTGLLHDAMNGILNAADTLVLVSSASVDGARSAATTFDWLEAQGYGTLVRSAVTVVSSVRPGGREVDVDAISRYFGSRSRAVVRIPFDPHLETGAETDLDALASATRAAYVELATAVAADFDRGDESARARRRGRPHAD